MEIRKTQENGGNLRRWTGENVSKFEEVENATNQPKTSKFWGNVLNPWANRTLGFDKQNTWEGRETDNNTPY